MHIPIPERKFLKISGTFFNVLSLIQQCFCYFSHEHGENSIHKIKLNTFMSNESNFIIKQGSYDSISQIRSFKKNQSNK